MQNYAALVRQMGHPFYSKKVYSQQNIIKLHHLRCDGNDTAVGIF